MAFLPTGGLYITGGLLRNLLESSSSKSNDSDTDECLGDKRTDTAVLPLLSVFLEAYCSKGAASFLLEDIPLYLVLAKDTGLRGAAVRAEMVRGMPTYWFDLVAFVLGREISSFLGGQSSSLCSPTTPPLPICIQYPFYFLLHAS